MRHFAYSHYCFNLPFNFRGDVELVSLGEKLLTRSKRRETVHVVETENNQLGNVTSMLRLEEVVETATVFSPPSNPSSRPADVPDDA